MQDKDWQKLAEDGLEELIKGATVTNEKLDKDGDIHTLTSKLPPNIDAIKFALKNRSNGKWADKVEITATQVNINLSASYNEVKALMQKEKNLASGKFIEAIPDDIIEVEVDNDETRADR